MEFLSQLLSEAVRWVGERPGPTLLIAAGAYLVLLVLVLWTMLRYARMARRQMRLLRGADGTSLERMLLDHADGSTELRAEVAAAAEASVRNADTLRQCLQRVGLVRYDAFGDVGGRQSFSVAVVDAEGSGIVLTGLHGRTEMRIYAKPVVAGRSPLALTEEERQAIAESRAGGPVLSGEEPVAGSANSGVGGGRRR